MKVFTLAWPEVITSERATCCYWRCWKRTSTTSATFSANRWLHEEEALKAYYDLLDCVQNKDVRLEEYARTQIAEEVTHRDEVEDACDHRLKPRGASRSASIGYLQALTPGSRSRPPSEGGPN